MSMKWRLNFYSAKPKQLKKLWDDYNSVTIEDDKILDANKMKTLVSFLDGLLDLQQTQQTGNIDELSKDIILVFKELTFISSILSKKLSEKSSVSTVQYFYDDSNYILNVLSKCLSALELISGYTNYYKPNSTILNVIQNDIENSRYLMEVIKTTNNITYLIQSIRILKVLSQDCEFDESYRFWSLDILSGVVRRTNDPSVIKQLANLIKVFSCAKLNNKDSKSENLSEVCITEKQNEPSNNNNPIQTAFRFIEDFLQAGNARPSYQDDLKKNKDKENIYNFETTFSFYENYVCSKELLEEEFNRLIFISTCEETENLNYDNTNSKDVYDKSLLKSINEAIADICILSLKQTHCCSDSIDIMGLLEDILTRNPSIMTIFIERNGCEVIFEMLERVEISLILLKPCMDESQTIASGGMNNFRKSNLNYIQQSNSVDYENYYNKLSLSLVNMILRVSSDDVNLSYGDLSLSNLSSFHGYLIENYELSKIITSLFLSSHIKLFDLGVQIISMLMYASSRNIMCLEMVGTINVLYLILSSFILLGSRPLLLSHPDIEYVYNREIKFDFNKTTSNIGFQKIENLELFLDRLQVIVELFQTIAVCLSSRDMSIISYFIVLLLSFDLCPLTHSCNQNVYYSNDMHIICQNCECEDAKYECLRCSYEGNFKSFRLCIECDRVFHKSIAKKGHIRIPIHPFNCNDNISLPLGINSLYSHLSHDCKLNYEKCVQIMKSEVVFDKQIEYSNKIIKIHQLLLNSIRNLIDDRKSRKMGVPISFIDSLSLLLRRYLSNTALQNSNVISSVTGNSIDKRIRQSSDFCKDMLTQFDRDIISNNFDGYDLIQPPEDIILSNRRILIALVTQCIGRVMLYCTKVSKITINYYSSSPNNYIYTPISLLSRNETDIEESLISFRSCGLDGIFISLILGDFKNSSFDLSSSDMHYLLWTFREIIIMSSVVSGCEIHLTSLLNWYIWMIDSKIDIPSVRTSLSKSQKYSNVSFSDKYSQIPNLSLTVNAQTRFLLLQEFRLILSITLPKQSENMYSLIEDYYVPSPIHIIPTAVPIIQTNSSRTNSFESISTSFSVNANIGGTSSTMMKQAYQSPFMYHVSEYHYKVIQVLNKLNAVVIFTRLAFGDLCNPKIKNIMNSKTANELTLSDLEIEEWWSCLTLWSTFISNNSQAKDVLHNNEEIAVIEIISILLNLASLVSNSKTLSHLYPTIIDIIIDLSTEGQLYDESFAFMQVTCRNPVSSNNWQDSSFNNVENVSGMSVLIERFLQNDLKVPTKQFDLINLCNDSGNIVRSPCNMSSIYIISSRTLSKIISTFRISYLNIFQRLENMASATRLQNKSTNLKKFRNESFVWSSLMGGVLNPIISDSTEVGQKDNFNGFDQQKIKSGSFIANGTSTISLSTLHLEHENWELESLGAKSSVLGDFNIRESNHSHHSLQALTIALSSLNNTPNASINGDVSVSNHSKHSSRKIIFDPIRNRSVSNENSTILTEINDFETSILQKMFNSEFPPVSNLKGISSSIYFPLSPSIMWGFDVHNDLISKCILYFYEYLVNIGGLHSRSDDVLFNNNSDTIIKYMLQKHLSLLIPSIELLEYNKENLTCTFDRLNSDAFESLKSFIHFPKKCRSARVTFRSVSYGYILLSVALLLTGKCQDYMISNLSFIFDACSASSLMMSNDIKSMHYFMSLISDTDDYKFSKFSYLFSQVLQNHLPNQILYDMIHEIKISIDLRRESVSSNLLYIMGRVTEKRNPTKIVESSSFGDNSSIRSYKKSFNLGANPFPKKIMSISFWIKSGQQGKDTFPNKNLFHVNTYSMDNKTKKSLYFFFRKIVSRKLQYDGIESNFDKNINHDESSHDHIEFEEAMQLCLSFNKFSNADNVNIYDLFDIENTNDREDISKSKSTDSAKSPKNSPRRPKDSFEDISTLNLSQSINSVMSNLSVISFPDIIIDYNWKDFSTWHLVVITMNDNEILCSINNISVPVLYWGPLGYSKRNEKDIFSIPAINVSNEIHNYYSLFGKNDIITSIDISIGEIDIMTVAKKRLVDELDIKMQSLRKLSKLNNNEDLNIRNEIFTLNKFCKTLIWLINSCERLSSHFNGYIGDFMIYNDQIEDTYVSEAVFVGPKFGHAQLRLKELAPIAAITAETIFEDKNKPPFLQAISSKGINEAIIEIGGFSRYLCLLATSTSTQVAVLRIISNIISKESRNFVQKYFIDNNIRNAILFCLVDNWKITNSSTLQAIYEHITFEFNSLSDKKSFEFIYSKPLLSLLFDTIEALQICPELARGTIDWIRGIADDCLSNCYDINETVGLKSILNLMTLWVFDNSFEKVDAVMTPNLSNSKSPERKSILSLNSDNNKIRGKDKVKLNLPKDNRTNLDSEKHRLQVSCGKLLQVMIYGTSSRDIDYKVIQSIQSSTGWTSVNMTTLFNFLVFCSRACFEEIPIENTQSPPISARQKPLNRRRPSDIAYFKSLRFSFLSNTISYILDSVISSLDSMVLSQIITMLKLSYPSIEYLWFIILEVIHIPSSQIITRSLKMLLITFLDSNGETDHRIISNFDKANGFIILSHVFQTISLQFSDEFIVIKCLLELLYWNDIRKAVSDSNKSESTMFSKGKSQDSSKNLNGNITGNQTILSIFGWGTTTSQNRSLYSLKIDGESTDANKFNNYESEVRKSLDSEEIKSGDSTDKVSINIQTNIIQIPHLIQIIFKFLQQCKNHEVIVLFVDSLEKSCLLNPDEYENIFKSNNLVKFWKIPDIMSIIAEYVSVQLRRIRSINSEYNVNMDESLLSDDVSVQSLVFSDTDTDISAVCSDDDTNSLASYFNNSNSSHNTMMQQYVDPIIKLIQRLLIQDIILYSTELTSNCEWNQLFQIQSPQYNEFQVMICYEMLQSIKSYFILHIDVCYKIIFQISHLLLRLIEKIEVPIDLCVKIIQEINLLSYECPPEIRVKLQNTAIAEVRRDFVERIILDRNDDLYTKTAALSSISISIQTYVSTTLSDSISVTKNLSDDYILFLVLAIFLEVYDDLEFITNDMVNTQTNENSIIQDDEKSINTYKISNESFKRGRSMSFPQIGNNISVISPYNSENDIVVRLQNLLDVMQTIISIIQICVSTSIECQKCMSKLVLDISYDVDNILEASLLHNFKRSVPLKTVDTTETVTSSIHPNVVLTDSIDKFSIKQGNWWTWSSTLNSTQSQLNQINKEPVDIESNINSNQNSLDNADVLSSTASLDIPKDISSFLDWYLSIENKNIHNEFRNRILKEIKPCMKYVEKFIDKQSLKRLKYQRISQDKHNKEITKSTKALKETLEKIRNMNSMKVKTVQNEMSLHNANLRSRIQIGKETYDTNIKLFQSENCNSTTENFTYDNSVFKSLFDELKLYNQ